MIISSPDPATHASIYSHTMTIRKWFPSSAPVTTITLAAILAASFALASTLLALSFPRLGVEFDRSYEGVGVRIESVQPNSPAAGKLFAGDIIESMATPAHEKIEVLSFATLEDPDQLSSYAEYNAFFKHQGEIWNIISSPRFTAFLRDGRHIELSPMLTPGFAVLTPAYWWLLFFGGVAFILGVSVWCLHRRELVTRVLVISGTGFMIGSFFCAIYISRELAIPSTLFFALSSLNHLGIMVFAYCTNLFFWYYPGKFSNKSVAWVFVVWIAAIWLNETLQWLSWPFHAFYLHFVVAYCVLVLFAILQWRQSTNAPLQRAILKWMLASMLISLGFTIFMFYIPVIMFAKPIATTVLTFSAVFALYLSLVIGIVRFQQFNMHHWWLKAWQWLSFVFIALIADLLFLYFLNLNSSTSITLAFLVSSVYLVVRQLYWGYYSGNSNQAMDHALPHLVEALILKHKKASSEQQWKHLLERVFNTISAKAISRKRDTIAIERDGLVLQIPTLDGLSTIEMFCCEGGKRIFTATDIHLAQRLLELMRHSRDMLKSWEQGVHDERHRIQRDLHDDVASRLLTLLHQTDEPSISNTARGALRGLRDVIHLLGDEGALLEDVLSDVEAESREQIGNTTVQLEWHAPDVLPPVTLSSLQHINIKRITREAISNALKHAKPQTIRLEISLVKENFYLSIENDGEIAEPSSWVAGRGQNNIKFRVAELKGSCKWETVKRGNSKKFCNLGICIPITNHE